MGIHGPSPKEGREEPPEAGRCGVDGGRGTDEAKGYHVSLVGDEDVERRETRLRGQDWKSRRPETVRNPSLDLPPINIHLGETPFSSDEQVGAIG